LNNPRFTLKTKAEPIKETRVNIEAKALVQQSLKRTVTKKQKKSKLITEIAKVT